MEWLIIFAILWVGLLVVRDAARREQNIMDAMAEEPETWDGE